MSYFTNAEMEILHSALRHEKSTYQSNYELRALVSIVDSLEGKFHHGRFEEDIRRQAKREAVTDFVEEIKTRAGRKWSPITGDDMLSISEDSLDELADEFLGGHGDKLIESREEIVEEEER